MHGNPAARELVERGQLARSDRRLRKSGSVGDEKAKSGCQGGAIGSNDLALRCVGAERDQNTVEAALFLHPQGGADIVEIKSAVALPMDGFRAVIEADIADEFDGH